MKALTPATAALTNAGVAYTIHRFDHDDHADGSFGEQARMAMTAQLDVDARQVVKTLIVAGSGLPRPGLAVAMIAVDDALSMKATAAALGVPKVAMAERAAAERATGYVVGGVAPLGHKTQLPLVIDAQLCDWPTMVCSGGRRGLEMQLAPGDLARITDAVVATIRSL